VKTTDASRIEGGVNVLAGALLWLAARSFPGIDPVYDAGRL